MSEYKTVAPLLGTINRTLRNDITLDELYEFEADIREKIILQIEPKYVISSALSLITALVEAKLRMIGNGEC